ncbi:unnamed protein product [Pleuronectes platessa]|uniref:Uncharacterized protein n=1 Tax=Pleuronectes platessa TaxID=8262 RepID=A0A9N7TGI3_PLEPL|nr:unnamed protein product [Pleuronectes platessa]
MLVSLLLLLLLTPPYPPPWWHQLRQEIVQVEVFKTTGKCPEHQVISVAKGLQRLSGDTEVSSDMRHAPFSRTITLIPEPRACSVQHRPTDTHLKTLHYLAATGHRRRQTASYWDDPVAGGGFSGLAASSSAVLSPSSSWTPGCLSTRLLQTSLQLRGASMHWRVQDGHFDLAVVPNMFTGITCRRPPLTVGAKPERPHLEDASYNAGVKKSKLQNDASSDRTM